MSSTRRTRRSSARYACETANPHILNQAVEDVETCAMVEIVETYGAQAAEANRSSATACALNVLKSEVSVSQLKELPGGILHAVRPLRGTYPVSSSSLNGEYGLLLKRLPSLSE